MTEQEWEACDDPQQMIPLLHRPSRRKMILYCCGCCRRIQHLATWASRRKLIEDTERIADRPLFGLFARVLTHCPNTLGVKQNKADEAIDNLLPLPGQLGVLADDLIWRVQEAARQARTGGFSNKALYPAIPGERRIA